MQHAPSTIVKLFLACWLLAAAMPLQAQMHNQLVNFSINGTPTYGVKIKTNLPFSSGTQMPTIHIYGYNFQLGQPIDLTLVYYIFGDAFKYCGVTSAGGYAPPIKLAQENSKVVIYIDDRVYYQRFTVSAYAKGMPADGVATYYQGWTAVDEALIGTDIVTVRYKNKIAGDLTLPGGIWSADGRLGIGTITPSEALSVNGNIRAHQIKVETEGWPDYVFDEDYTLMPLETLEMQIKKQGHLPDIPSAELVQAEGQDLGEVNKQLLKKMEELTLYIIRQNKRLDQLEKQILSLGKK